jgi:hypothetical protein
MAEGQAADHGGPLGVEEDEQAGQAVLGLEAVVVEQPAGLLPAGLGVDHPGRAAPPGCREVQRGEPVPACPADEVPRVGAVAGLGVAQPRIEVALPRGLEGQLVAGEPVKQDDGGLDVPLGAEELAVGGVLSGQTAAEPAHDVPDGVLVQQLALGGATAFGDSPGDPGFQPGELLVAGRQRPGGDEDRAQVPQRLAVRELVEGGVGEGPFAGGELAQHGGVLVVVQPAQHGSRTAGADQAVAECP